MEPMLDIPFRVASFSAIRTVCRMAQCDDYATQFMGVATRLDATPYCRMHSSTPSEKRQIPQALVLRNISFIESRRRISWATLSRSYYSSDAICRLTNLCHHHHHHHHNKEHTPQHGMLHLLFIPF
mmetsp:Transcript_13957/g.29428  ORF Transcript_13957/g.29428 Transcript_13957/m.29428 type:complete len:126 (-) Transcript_13957:564-941(-)